MPTESQQEPEPADICEETRTASEDKQPVSEIGQGQSSSSPTSEPISAESEMPEVGMVRRHTQDIETKLGSNSDLSNDDGQKSGVRSRTSSDAHRFERRDSRKRESNGSRLSSGPNVADSVLEDSNVHSQEHVEVETIVKVSARKSPSSSPDITKEEESDDELMLITRPKSLALSEEKEQIAGHSTPSESQSQSVTTPGQPAYVEEDIPWSVGTVKQHKEAIESKVKELEQPTPLTRKDSEEPKCRMSNETLKLIREIGSVILNSPTRPTPPTPQSPSGLGMVHRVTRDIELKFGTPKYRKRLIIIEKEKLPKASDNKEPIPSSSTMHLDVTTVGSILERDSNVEDPNMRPRSPNIHSIDIQSKAIPKDSISKSETVSEGSVSKGVAHVQRASQAGHVQRASQGERKIIIQEKEEMLSKCIVGRADEQKVSSSVGKDQEIHESPASISSSDSDSEKKPATWEDVNVKQLVGRFETPGAMSPTDELPGTTFESKTPVSRTHSSSFGERDSQMRPKSDTNSQLKEKVSKQPSSGKQDSNQSAKTESKPAGVVRKISPPHVSTDSKQSESKPRKVSPSGRTSRELKVSTKTTPSKSNASRIRTVSEPPEKSKGVSKSGSDGSKKSDIERKTSLPVKVTSSANRSSDEDSSDQSQKRSHPGSRRPKSANQAAGFAAGFEVKTHTRAQSLCSNPTYTPASPQTATPSSPQTATPSPAQSATTTSPARPVSGSGLSPVPTIPSEREPDPGNLPKIRKLHGKTHPLAKLTQQDKDNNGSDPRNNPFYSTM